MEKLSRQVSRQIARRQAKNSAAEKSEADRTAARRELLRRQSEREKSGFYTGRSVGANVSPSRSRIQKRKVQKGKAFGRILRTISECGREIQFHATKGCRNFRAEG